MDKIPTTRQAIRIIRKAVEKTEGTAIEATSEGHIVVGGTEQKLAAQLLRENGYDRTIIHVI